MSENKGIYFLQMRHRSLMLPCHAHINNKKKNCRINVGPTSGRLNTRRIHDGLNIFDANCSEAGLQCILFKPSYFRDHSFGRIDESYEPWNSNYELLYCEGFLAIHLLLDSFVVIVIHIRKSLCRSIAILDLQLFSLHNVKHNIATTSLMLLFLSHPGWQHCHISNAPAMNAQQFHAMP